jgi:Fe-S cluster assembly protein SufD
MLDHYLNQFENEIPKGGPAFLEERRQQGLKYFTQLGFPTRKLESWKYTGVDSILQNSFRLITHYESNGLKKDQLSKWNFGCESSYRIVFVDGHYSKKHSSFQNLPNGVLIGSLARALEHHTALVEQHLHQLTPYQTHPFAALNTAFTQDGAFVYIPSGTVLDHPIQFLFFFTSDQTPYLSHPHNLFILGAHSQAAIFEGYVSEKAGVYFTNAATEIALEENAILDHHKIQEESLQAFHIATTNVKQGGQSVYRSHQFSWGASLTRSDLSTLLNAEGAETMLNGLYLANGKQHVDNHTSIDHAKPHCTSTEMYKGILDGSAQGVFDGKIIVRPDAQKTSARQTNKNLILSDNALINTKPLLEIFADDVKCNHGATIGRLDENQLFYLRARGIDAEVARNILTYAFASEMVTPIGLAGARSYLQEKILGKLRNADCGLRIEAREGV